MIDQMVERIGGKSTDGPQLQSAPSICREGNTLVKCHKSAFHKCRRRLLYNIFLRTFGMKTTGYLHSDFE